LSLYSRERNRMHAKMTRDRKKNYIASIEETIDKLVKENDRMRGILSKVASSNHVTPMTSPELTNVPSPLVDDYEEEDDEEEDDEADVDEDELDEDVEIINSIHHVNDHLPPRKRHKATPHGFRLDE
jgi:Basic region leucine zipper